MGPSRVAPGPTLLADGVELIHDNYVQLRLVTLLGELLLGVGKEVADILLGLANVRVEDLGARHDFRLLCVEELADFACDERLAGAGRAVEDEAADHLHIVHFDELGGEEPRHEGAAEDAGELAVTAPDADELDVQGDLVVRVRVCGHLALPDALARLPDEAHQLVFPHDGRLHVLAGQGQRLGQLVRHREAVLCRGRRDQEVRGSLREALRRQLEHGVLVGDDVGEPRVQRPVDQLLPHPPVQFVRVQLVLLVLLERDHFHRHLIRVLVGRRRVHAHPDLPHQAYASLRSEAVVHIHAPLLALFVWLRQHHTPVQLDVHR